MKDCLSVHGWSCWEASSFSSPSTSLLCLNNLSLIPPLLYFPPLPSSFLFSSFLFSSFLSFSPPPSLVLLYPFPPLPDSYLLSLPSSASLNTSPCSLLSSSSLYWTPLLCLILLLFTIVSCLSFALLTLPHMIFSYRHILLMMTAPIFWGSILTGSSLSLDVFAPD